VSDLFHLSLLTEEHNGEGPIREREFFTINWKGNYSPIQNIFRPVRKIGKSDYLSVCPSINWHETTRFPLEGFSWNFI